METKSFVAAMKDFFGLKPGQTIGGFGAELTALTAEDKHELWQLLNAAGYACRPPDSSQPARPAA